MVLRRRAELAATSRADELALRALAEITGDENVRIVGGQMVSLLLAAFPVPGIAPRRTRDADTAITTELAGSGVLDDHLTARGWAATAGNNYARPVPELSVSGQSAPELSVDLLVPSLDGRFRPSQHGGRAFDSAPWLAPALAAEPVEIARADSRSRSRLVAIIRSRGQAASTLPTSGAAASRCSKLSRTTSRAGDAVGAGDDRCDRRWRGTPRGAADRRIEIRIDDLSGGVASVQCFCHRHVDLPHLIDMQDGWKIVNAAWRLR